MKIRDFHYKCNNFKNMKRKDLIFAFIFMYKKRKDLAGFFSKTLIVRMKRI